MDSLQARMVQLSSVERRIGAVEAAIALGKDKVPAAGEALCHSGCCGMRVL